MVNEKQTKRERNIKSKLMAAIAMLLVSSIMMVSTTYAWFTLSTAPEVTGITTTIASNGNLEIALAPPSGLGANVGDATTATLDWAAKNLTWGNLVDMCFVGNTYGLEDLALAPAELAALGSAEAGFTLNAEGALATPKYGSDGRISELVTDAVMAHKTETGYAKPGEIENEDGSKSTESFKYGVRAVGTSSGQSAQQVKFRNALNAITTYASSATTAAASALNNNGEALASIMVQHAMGNDSDYKAHVSTLITLTNTLNTIPGYLDNAVRSALIAAACSLDTEAFNTAIEAIEGKNPDGSYKNTVSSLISQYGGDVATALSNLLAEIEAVNGQIDAASRAAKNLESAATVDWNAVSTVLTNLMNVNNENAITVGGIKISDLKAKADAKDIAFFMSLATNCVIELHEGSGVFYDLAEIAGNIQAKTSAEIDASFMTPGVTTIVPLDNVIMKTSVSGVSKLEGLKTTIKGAITAAGDSGAAALDAFYGYIIDLMVRTNAADSSLQLQSAAAQRVYAESANEATMGGGASIIFKVASTKEDPAAAAAENEAKAAIISDLCSSIRVVFFDPSNGTNKIFSLAKVTGVAITDGTTSVTAEGATEATEIPCKIVTGTIELCEMVADGTGGLYVAGDVKSSAVLCPLTQNVPQAISVMVYLDGNNVTSSDVLADEAVVGALNLQFSSTATLNPMMNSDLFKGEETAGN